MDYSAANAALWNPVMQLGLIAVALLAANMMESTLLFYSFISGYAFFLACGYAHGAAERKATEEEHPAQET